MALASLRCFNFNKTMIANSFSGKWIISVGSKYGKLKNPAFSQK
jgi:hypothetical protein